MKSARWQCDGCREVYDSAPMPVCGTCLRPLRLMIRLTAAEARAVWSEALGDLPEPEKEIRQMMIEAMDASTRR